MFPEDTIGTLETSCGLLRGIQPKKLADARCDSEELQAHCPGNPHVIRVLSVRALVVGVGLSVPASAFPGWHRLFGLNLE